MITQNIQMVDRNNNYKNREKISFQATPKQILAALDTVELMGDAGNAILAKDKRPFLKSMSEFFNEIGGKIETEFKYFLGQENKIPEEIGDLSHNGCTLKQMDNLLDKGSFDATPDDISFGEFSLGGIAREDLSKLGVEEPDFIRIGKNK